MFTGICEMLNLILKNLTSFSKLTYGSTLLPFKVLLLDTLALQNTPNSVPMGSIVYALLYSHSVRTNNWILIAYQHFQSQCQN